MRRPILDLTGQRFNRLTVLQRGVVTALAMIGFYAVLFTIGVVVTRYL
jgi:hypothetical protein